MPEKPSILPKIDLECKENATPALITTEVRDDEIAIGNQTIHKDFNRLSVSLVDFSSIDLAAFSGKCKIDKQNGLSNIASPLPHMILEKNSKSYLNIQDYTSHSNHEPEYETLLSPTAISTADSNHVSNSVSVNYACQNKQRKESENLVFIDLNEDEDEHKSVEGPTVPRPRARSMQWIQNTFQNVTNKYKSILEFRRPSDIAEERMRKSNEELDMEELESETTTDNKPSPSVGNRRFSENVIGKQKRFPFVSRLGHLKGLWKDRNLVSKRQEEKDNDQTRADVCPLFTFPRKRDEDELILDALRQAMRKCTAVDPSTRPNSTTVLDQLSNLLEDR